MTSHKLIVALATGALALGVAACGDDDEDATADTAGASTEQAAGGESLSDLSATLRFDGSSTVQPLAEAAVELFGEEAPGVNITVGGVGTGDGFDRFCRGELTAADASRRIEADELATCEENGTQPVEVQVGIDGLSVVANPGLEIPNDCITTEQLKQLLAPDSAVSNYSELGAGFPDQDVQFFTPGTESGTYDYFTEAVLETDAEQRTDKVQTSADDNQIITGIAGTDGALGYVGYAFAVENEGKVKTLAVDAGEGCVAPTTETIASGEYAPLSRPLFMYPSVETAKEPATKAFIQFILDNNETVTEAAGYIPITEEIKATSQANLDSATPITAADLEG